MAERAPALARTYKIAEIAERFGVTVKRVYGWIEERELVALRLPGRKGGGRIDKKGRPIKDHFSLRVRQEDLDDFERQWLGQNSQSPSTGSGREGESLPSAGPTRRQAKQSPYQQGKVMKLVPKSGGINS